MIDRNDLVHLTSFAESFLRTSPYCEEYRDSLLAITLCQGAANHYYVCQGEAKRYFDPDKKGIKDFDIWFFFREHEGRKFNRRWIVHRDFGTTKFGKNPDDIGYEGRRVDFLGRTILTVGMNPEESITHWLKYGDGSAPDYLSKKAVVGLYPESILGKIIWVNPNFRTLDIASLRNKFITNNYFNNFRQP